MTDERLVAYERHGWWIALLVLFALAKGIAWSIAVPIAQQPDEPAHVVVADHIARTGALTPGPRVPSASVDLTIEALDFHRIIFRPWSLGSVDDASVDRRHDLLQRSGERANRANDGAYDASAEAYPPFYYALQALVVRGTDTARYDVTWMLERLLSVLLSALTAVVMYVGFLKVLGRPWKAAGATLVTTSVPAFSSVESAVNPEVLIVLLGTSVLVACLHVLERPDRRRVHLAIGAMIAVAILTKPSGIVLAAPYAAALVAVVVARRRDRLPLRRFLGSASMAIGISVAAALAWRFAPVRAGGRFGADPANLVARVKFDAANIDAYLAFLTREARFRYFDSFWGVFGWVDSSMPGWYMLLAAFGTAAICTLFVLQLIRDKVPSWFWVYGVAIAAVLLMLLYVEFGIVVTTGTGMVQGRYFYGVIFAMAAIAVRLVDDAVAPRPVLQRALWAATPLVALVGQAVALFGVVLPRYYL